MSVYNANEYISESIQSILGQTFRDFEFIIIDDGSTDNSIDIVRTFQDERIKLYEQENNGLAIALNRGIEYSNTGIIARMDADDISLPDRLEKQLVFLNDHPDYVLIGSNAMVIDKNGEYVYTSDLPLTWDKIRKAFPNAPFFHSSVMFRKEAFYSSGRYPEEVSKFNCFEDSLLWNRMKEVGPMANMEEALIMYRLLPNASTSKSGKESKLRDKIFKEIILNNYISDLNSKLLMETVLNRNKISREYEYYIHISKKYLFDNFLPKNARKNIINAIKIKIYKPVPYLLLVLSFFPDSLVRSLKRQILYIIR